MSDTETRTPFPERMHKQAVATLTRRVERALKELSYEVEIIGRRVGNDTADADDARKAAELVTTIASRLGALEALRDTREWDEAEADAAAAEVFGTTHQGRTIDARNNTPAGEQS